MGHPLPTSTHGVDGGKTAHINALIDLIEEARNGGCTVLVIDPKGSVPDARGAEVRERIAALATGAGLTVHTKPRLTMASYVREGDQVATYPGTGLLAGPEDAVARADWRGEIVWVEVATYVGYVDSDRRGILATDRRVLPADPDKHVVIREAVTVPEHL